MIIDYNEAYKKTGIYKIENTKTNRTYIGQSNNIYKRWKKHRISLLKTNMKMSFFKMIITKLKRS
jgi:hypothetical protein